MKNILWLLCLSVCFSVIAQDLPCIIKREVSDQELGIIDRYLDQCLQQHVAIIHSNHAKSLYEKLITKEESEEAIDKEITLKSISFNLSNTMTDFIFSIDCKKTTDNSHNDYFCVFKSPILTSGQMDMGMGDYNPNLWVAKFHSQFFIRNQKYVFSPRQEFIFALNSGAQAFKNIFSESDISFTVLDSEGYPTLALSCKEVMNGDKTSPLCRIIF